LVCDERSYLALLKCAALLHSAKADPATLAERWRLSKREAQLLQTAIHHYPDVTALVEQADTSRRSIYRFFSQTGEHGIDAALLSLAHAMSEQDQEAGPRWTSWTQTVGRLLEAWFEQRDTLISPAPLLSGRDVMQALDLPPGPQIGELLQRLAEEQAAGEILTRQQALTFVQQWKKRG
jgi:tRNA nucleotidyltransferase/poly(A) polymerase